MPHIPLLTQSSKNNCGETVIQQYLLYQNNLDTHLHNKQHRWGMTPQAMAECFSAIHTYPLIWKSHHEIADIKKCIQTNSFPIPVLGLVASNKNPHKKLCTNTYVHGLHYYLLLADTPTGFLVYNPFGYEEIITYEQRDYLFGYADSPTIQRKRYEKLLHNRQCIKKNWLLIPKHYAS